MSASLRLTALLDRARREERSLEVELVRIKARLDQLRLHRSDLEDLADAFKKECSS